MDGPAPAGPELLRGGRRRRGAAGPGGGAAGPGGGAAAVARRNERERNRVRLVNLGFQALRQHVPPGGASRRLSKVETLRSAVEYIRALQRLLAEHAAGAPAGSEPGSPRSACSSDDSGCEAELSPAARDPLGFSSWWGGF